MSRRSASDVRFALVGKAGSTLTATATPGDMLFKGYRLEVEKGAAKSYIQSIRIGGHEALAVSDVPCAYFRPEDMENLVALPTCKPGEQIEVSVRFEEDCEWAMRLEGETRAAR